MKYAVKICPGARIYIPRLKKNDSSIQKLMGTHTGRKSHESTLAKQVKKL
jgi:hypothetical protein